MSTGAKLELTRLAIQLAIELMRDRNRRMIAVTDALGLPQKADMLAVVDAIRDHLSKPFSAQ